MGGLVPELNPAPETKVKPKRPSSFHKNSHNPEWNQKIRNVIIERFAETPKVIKHLLSYYSEDSDHRDAQNAGEIIEVLIKDERLASGILNNHWESFFVMASLSDFGKLSNALEVFNQLLTKHRETVARFLREKNEKFFKRFNTDLIGANCDNFVVKKSSVKLLSGILSAKENYKVMLAYVTDSENLRVIMTLLQNRSPSIQFEAFHVFKIFVANPHW